MSYSAISMGSILFIGGYVVYKVARSLKAPLEASTYKSVWQGAGLMLVVSFLTDVSPQLGAAFGAMIVAGFAISRVAKGESILPSSSASSAPAAGTGVFPGTGAPANPPVTGHTGSISCPSGTILLAGKCVPISIN